jgi:hypothetical protein
MKIRFTPPQNLTILTLLDILLLFANTVISHATTYHVNERDIHEMNGLYFIIVDNDTTYLDPRFITIKSKQGEKSEGMEYLTTHFGLEYLGESSGEFIVCKVTDQETPYPLLVSQINSFNKDDNLLPGIIARNILHAAGQMDYEEPINLNISTKSSSIPQNEIEIVSESTNDLSYLRISPNPATDYFIADYSTGVQSGQAYLKISNSSGQKISVIFLQDLKNSVVVPVNGVEKGLYIVTLFQNNKSLTSTPIIIR